MRALAWQGVEEWLAEHAQVDVLDDGVFATGVQLGVEPEPYRLDYLLDVPSGWITRRLEVEASGAGWRRSLSLEHDGRGGWTADGEPVADVDGALDCDLAFSPLTNLMPVRAAGCTRAPAAGLRRVRVSVPDLRLQCPAPARARAPALQRGLSPPDGDFTADLDLHAARGCAIHAPAQRVGARSAVSQRCGPRKRRAGAPASSQSTARTSSASRRCSRPLSASSAGDGGRSGRRAVELCSPSRSASVSSIAAAPASSQSPPGAASTRRARRLRRGAADPRR
jgi:hypothetical protein